MDNKQTGVTTHLGKAIKTYEKMNNRKDYIADNEGTSNKVYQIKYTYISRVYMPFAFLRICLYKAPASLNLKMKNSKVCIRCL